MYAADGSIRVAQSDVRSQLVATFKCLTFLSDYGLEDGFVAACHGVAARLAPDALVIDVTHLVPPGDVRRGAAVLAQTVPYLPPAVHVAVVDPGVGTARLGIAVQAGERVFVGPDNGVLSWAVTGAGGADRAVQLSNSDLWLHPVSPTFADMMTLPAPTSRLHDDEVEGEVMSVDRFGNVQLSIKASEIGVLGAAFGSTLVVRCGRRQLTVPYLETFAAVAPGELVAFTDSAGLVALAVNAGDAAQRLGLPPGAHVRLAAAP